MIIRETWPIFACGSLFGIGISLIAYGLMLISRQPKQVKVINPPGYDTIAHGLHDGEPTASGFLHFTTCWCRRFPGMERDREMYP